VQFLGKRGFATKARKGIKKANSKKRKVDEFKTVASDLWGYAEANGVLLDLIEPGVQANRGCTGGRNTPTRVPLQLRRL
jgi:hypothetical protein